MLYNTCERSVDITFRYPHSHKLIELYGTVLVLHSSVLSVRYFYTVLVFCVLWHHTTEHNTTLVVSHFSKTLLQPYNPNFPLSITLTSNNFNPKSQKVVVWEMVLEKWDTTPTRHYCKSFGTTLHGCAITRQWPGPQECTMTAAVWGLTTKQYHFLCVPFNPSLRILYHKTEKKSHAHRVVCQNRIQDWEVCETE